jgi:hypothetical protein
MSHSSRSGRRSNRTLHGALAVAAFGLAVLVSASAAFADSKSGTTGAYKFTDSSGSPGTTCNYTGGYPNHYLLSFGVRAPSVKWPTSDSSASGRVDWWLVIQHYSGGWSTVKTTTHKTATATKTAAAPFAKWTLKYAAPNADAYRLVAHLAWYTPDSTVLGAVTHPVAHYRGVYPGWSNDTAGSCPGGVTILT